MCVYYVIHSVQGKYATFRTPVYKTIVLFIFNTFIIKFFFSNFAHSRWITIVHEKNIFFILIKRNNVELQVYYTSNNNSVKLIMWEL